jgi:hypothetical protein
MAPTTYYMGLRRHKVDGAAMDLLAMLGTGFEALLDEGYTSLDALLDVAEHARIFAADFDQLCRCFNLPKKRQTLEAPNTALVKFTRWCVLSDLLNLPDRADQPDLSAEEVVYEMCRAILFSFAVFVMVPMPLKSKVHERIANTINDILNRAVATLIHIQHPEVFLTTLAWGFMCAHKATSHPDLGGLLRNLLGHLEMTTMELHVDRWDEVSDIMRGFLWLDSFCDESGRKFWACACGMAKAKRERREMSWRSV